MVGPPFVVQKEVVMKMSKDRVCANPKCKKPLTGKLRRATRCTECQREVNTFGKNAPAKP